SSVWFQDSNLDGRNDLMIDLGTLTGDGSSQAQDINNAGQVVGGSTGGGFLWDAVTGMVNLGNVSPAAINEQGQVAGTTADFPFRWDAVNGMTILNPGPGYLYGHAASINDAGWVVGSLEVDTGSVYTHPQSFMWQGGTSFGSPFSGWGGNIGSTADDINNVGDVVG